MVDQLLEECQGISSEHVSAMTTDMRISLGEATGS